MHVEVKNRDWVKNAAIIFLSILLVLTFFSNTIMNRSLPEVSTLEATNGTIVAKVRGTGVVVANGNYQEKAAQTREIRAVLVKEGQQVTAGDPLFVLGEGNSEELEALQEQLRSQQLSYQRASINMPTFEYALEEKKEKAAKEKWNAAEASVVDAKKQLEAAANVDVVLLEELKKQVDKAQIAYDEESNRASAEKEKYAVAVESARKDYEELVRIKHENVDVPEDIDQQIEVAGQKLAQAQKELDSLEFPSLIPLKNYLDEWQKKYDDLLNSAGAAKVVYDKAVSDRDTAKEEYETFVYEWNQQKARDNKTQQLAYLELGDIASQITKTKEKIKELSGGEENQILAKVSGTVQSVECMAGDTVQQGAILCSIEVPDMGYSLSFSVTNEQARRLKPGDTATVSNFYWGNEIVATLSTIKTDPKSPMTNKVLNFDLAGDVTAGAELSISVGSKSAGYDVVVPNSAIKNDTNGSFVYVIEAKNSPLGNRYSAKRASVEVLASDDNNSAVIGDIENGDYVITISNAPIKNGEMVRMAD